MSNLALYNPSNQYLAPVSFIKSLVNQTKIKDITESDELSKLFSVNMPIISNLSGVKEPISKISKEDIKDLITSKYKTLSFDEISYAFKLERHGELKPRTEHFQLFDAVYVSKVLDKYLEWKKGIRMINNIKAEHNKPKESTISKSEKTKIMVDGLTELYNEYHETSKLPIGRTYMYDWLDKNGVMPTDIEEKKSIKKVAVRQIKTRRSTSLTREEALLYDLNKKSGQSALITLCKEISLKLLFDKNSLESIIGKIEKRI